MYTVGWKNLIGRAERGYRLSVCARPVAQPPAHSPRARKTQVKNKLGRRWRNDTGATVTHGSRVAPVSTPRGGFFPTAARHVLLKDTGREKNVWG